MALATPPATERSLKRLATTSPRARSPSPLRAQTVEQMVKELSQRRMASPRRAPASPRRRAPASPRRAPAPKSAGRRRTTGSLAPRAVPTPARARRATSPVPQFPFANIGEYVQSASKMELGQFRQTLKNMLGDVEYALGRR